VERRILRGELRAGKGQDFAALRGMLTSRAAGAETAA
jgi:hypothetical protein